VTMRRAIVALAHKLIGIPYIWGGSSPRVGFDCSGFVIWILQVFDALPGGDWTADGLCKKFPKTDAPKPGDLVFYGRRGSISHVMLYAGEMEGVQMCIGASGGDSRTTTAEEARKRNAMVKLKDVRYRSDFVQFGSIGIEV